MYTYVSETALLVDDRNLKEWGFQHVKYVATVDTRRTNASRGRAPAMCVRRQDTWQPFAGLENKRHS